MVIYILLCVLGFDFIWYRSNAVTFLNFLKVNIIDGIASEYGTHQLGWYITQGQGSPDWRVQTPDAGFQFDDPFQRSSGHIRHLLSSRFIWTLQMLQNS